MDQDKQQKQHKQQIASDFLKDHVDRARAVINRGNRLGSAYLAEIAGMWSNALKRSNDNPFKTNRDDSWLYRWFANGYEDYTQALGMNDEIRKKQLEREKAWVTEHETEKKVNPKKDTSKWDIKLW